MDTTIFTLIGSYGFPIIMCLLMYKQQNRTLETHKAEIEELRKTIDNNTKVVVKLVDKIEEML